MISLENFFRRYLKSLMSQCCILQVLFGTYYVVWYVLRCLVRITLFGTYYVVWYVLRCLVRITLFGTYYVVWYVLRCLVRITLFGTYYVVWYVLRCLVRITLSSALLRTYVMDQNLLCPDSHLIYLISSLIFFLHLLFLSSLFSR